MVIFPPHGNSYGNTVCHTSTISNGDQCKHETGWFVHPTFWIFARRFFVCSDCGDFIPMGGWYLK